MKALVIHAPHDLRVEERAVEALGPHDIAVKIAAGGICGSDLHYYHQGGFGTVRIKEPMILGHEIAGVVDAVGPAVVALKPGDRVAVSPSRPCGQCRYCREGRHNHCLNMRFYGSAMPFPHIQGAFREVLVCDAVQAHRVADHVSLSEAAFAEPLAVCLHAVRRAGAVLGKRVLVTGCGPIGALCALAARAAGAAEIVATDIAEAPIAMARRLGVDRAVNTATEPQALADYEADKGSFDVLFEASGNGGALTGALAALRPGGIVVQVGTGGEFAIPISVLVAKELELRGSFRFHEEFALAVAMLGAGRIDVGPLLTATFPVDRAVEAFDLASDRSRAMKVQLAFA
ncbi:L-idonate 5-dehydrogenase [Phreatobacter stygius]|uniref:L-idonate 5-dehydrogenase n=1 Tax=Phreatobacter stygius TaxID=1940610 RepID=A0A4D7B9J5_9HYPH|nr:L-idonate 5-dehydrogenase [Phreatobacter stygius]QCI64777.1 L-idonate 5-dehydrogenase [Phreatobacter stygius]